MSIGIVSLWHGSNTLMTTLAERIVARTHKAIAPFERRRVRPYPLDVLGVVA